MLVYAKQCKTVNAYCEIYDDCCIDDTQGILDRCAERLLSEKVKELQKKQTKKSTA
jgi:hypothetical protein